MASQLFVKTLTDGEIRITSVLGSEEINHGVYIRGLNSNEARALAEELILAADKSDQRTL
jgi:hypothetical protein